MDDQPPTSVVRGVIINVMVTVVIATLTLFWNWVSKGGLIYALQGARLVDIHDEVNAEISKRLGDGGVRPPSVAVDRSTFDNAMAELRAETAIVVTGRGKCPGNEYRAVGDLLVGIDSDYSGAWNDVFEVASFPQGIRLSPIIDPKWIVAHPTICVRK